MSNLKKLLDTLPQVGQLKSIALRPEKRAPLVAYTEARVSTETGLIGDHYSSRSGKRQITLIQAEHLEAVGKILGQDGAIDPLLTRRNLVVSRINLLALKGKTFAIGDEVILEGTGPCEPCSRMETNFGPGGYNAMRGHGGLCARVLRDGIIKVGDEVRFLTAE